MPFITIGMAWHGTAWHDTQWVLFRFNTVNNRKRHGVAWHGMACDDVVCYLSVHCLHNIPPSTVFRCNNHYISDIDADADSGIHNHAI
eukprot:jgi/Psemu1/45299/gm1.45299_g